MSLRKKKNSKSPTIEAFESGRQIKYELDTPRAMYNDTSGFPDNREEVLIWGDVYQMF